MDSSAAVISESSDNNFIQDVMEASKSTAVLVDFWAPWCGPCRQLTPLLERLVRAENGAVRLVKINIDENPAVASQLGVQSVPAVFAFKDGRPIDGFMGVRPESELKKFITRLIGTSDRMQDADALVVQAKDSLSCGDAGGAAQDFAQALQIVPDHAGALSGLARLYMQSGQDQTALELLENAPESITDHPEMNAVRTALKLKQADPNEVSLTELSAQVEASPDDLDARLNLAKTLVAQGQSALAIEHLLYAVGKNRQHDEGAARKFLLEVFEAEGAESETVISARRALSSILFS